MIEWGNQYMNCTLKNIYCIKYFLRIQQMNDCEPQSWTAAVWLQRHCSTGMVGLVYTHIQGVRQKIECAHPITKNSFSKIWP